MPRVWKSELSGATAVIVNGTATRTIVCEITEPSVDAKFRSSFTKNSPEFTNRTPFTFIASAFALSRRSARCSIGIVNGSILKALFHVAFGYACDRRELDGLIAGDAICLGDRDGFSRGRRDAVGGERLGRAESPRAVDERADAGADRSRCRPC